MEKALSRERTNCPTETLLSNPALSADSTLSKDARNLVLCRAELSVSRLIMKREYLIFHLNHYAIEAMNHDVLTCVETARSRVNQFQKEYPAAQFVIMQCGENASYNRIIYVTP